MSPTPDLPYRLCGCVSFATEAEARAVQAFLREILGAGGFGIEHVEKMPDGAEIHRRIP